MARKKATPKPRKAAPSRNLTQVQVAAILGVSVTRVQQLVAAQKLCPVNLGPGPGGGLVFSRADVSRHKRTECEREVARELERGTSPLDMYFLFDGKYSLRDVRLAMDDWAKLTGCWVIEAPRGSYARWLERMQLTSISPRQLRRLIEAMLADPAIAARVRSYLVDQRAHNGQGEAKAAERAERARVRGGKRQLVELAELDA